MSKWLLLAIGIDRFIAIFKPLKHNNWDNYKYVAVFSLPGLIFGLYFVVNGFINNNNDIISVCNPLSSMTRYYKEVFSLIVLILCIGVIFIYILTFIILFKFMPNNSSKSMIKVHRRVLITLSINALFFVISTCFGYFVLVLAFIIEISKTIKDSIDALVAIPVMLTSSSTYYLLLWRSEDYQKVFLRKLTCKKWSEDGKSIFVRTHVKETI
uniref:G_PROTEIN_RECEP_F1_2 domain-containing protein n=1 Tax=Parastrongyloides trichosuri TaxID=131310 RepID=A0A0N4Z7L1_PARTI